MQLPGAIYTELAARHGVTLTGATDETVCGLRMADGAAEPGWLYAPADAPAAFFNEAMELTERCCRWLTELDAAAGQGAGPQELIDRSEDMLGEPMFVVDPSMKCIAVTHRRTSTDIFFTEIAERGYPTLATYDRLEKENYYDKRLYSGRIMRLETASEPRREVALRGLRVDGKLAATALMVFYNGPWSEGKLGLFSLLSDRIAATLEGPWLQSDRRSERYNFLLRELLAGKALSDEEIAARLRYTGRRDPCPCRVLLLVPRESSRARPDYIARVLEGAMPGLRAVVEDGRVMTMLPSVGAEPPAELEELCETTGCDGGFSAELGRLSALKEAFEQADRALFLGRALSRPGSWYSRMQPAGERHVFRYDELAPYCVLREYMTDRAADGLCRRELLRLREQDERRGTDDMLVLFRYLEGHLNCTEAARRLSMHRNSVFYRIERICRTLGVQQIDAALERALRFSYMVLDVQSLSEISTNKD